MFSCNGRALEVAANAMTLTFHLDETSPVFLKLAEWKVFIVLMIFSVLKCNCESKVEIQSSTLTENVVNMHHVLNNAQFFDKKLSVFHCFMPIFTEEIERNCFLSGKFFLIPTYLLFIHQTIQLKLLFNFDKKKNYFMHLIQGYYE